MYLLEHTVRSLNENCCCLYKKKKKYKNRYISFQHLYEQYVMYIYKNLMRNEEFTFQVIKM